MGTLQGLARRMEVRADSIDDEASQLAVETTLIMLKYLVYETPVDESTALSNWQVSLNIPVVEEIDAFVSGVFGSTRTASASAAIEQARSVLARKKPGDDIYLSNVLDYIRKLNAGSSAQSSGAFVEAAILLGRDYLKTRDKD